MRLSGGAADPPTWPPALSAWNARHARSHPVLEVKTYVLCVAWHASCAYPMYPGGAEDRRRPCHVREDLHAQEESGKGLQIAPSRRCQHRSSIRASHMHAPTSPCHFLLVILLVPDITHPLRSHSDEPHSPQDQSWRAHEISPPTRSSALASPRHRVSINNRAMTRRIQCAPLQRARK